MQYTIHGGADRIGGMCIEVRADDGTRILLDLGTPLYDGDGSEYEPGIAQRDASELEQLGVLPRIPGLVSPQPDEPPMSAIILTHAHADHYGLAHHAHRGVPVYGSRGTLALLEVGRVFFPSNELPVDLRVLPDDRPLEIGGLRITAIPVDHAAPDSRALVVEADSSRLVYSGDLRSHGRTGYRFDDLLHDRRASKPDWLLLEGTTLGAPAGSHGFRSEQEVENGLLEICRTRADKLIAVFGSAQNLDRLVSCSHAADKSNRVLVIDPYQAYVLRELAPLSKRVPQYTWDGVAVCFAPHHVKALKDAGMMELVCDMRDHGKVSTDELRDHPGRYLWCARANYGATKVLDKVGADAATLVWSMWSGYWRRDRSSVRSWAEASKAEVSFVHSGGHAGPEDLQRLVEALEPKELVWVHTEANTSA